MKFNKKPLATHDSFPWKLQELTNEYPNIPLDYMSFAPKWKEENSWIINKHN